MQTFRKIFGYPHDADTTIGVVRDRMARILAPCRRTVLHGPRPAAHAGGHDGADFKRGVVIGLLIAAAAWPASGLAEPLQRVRLDTEDPATVARTLEAQGYDVIHDGVDAEWVDVIVSSEEWEDLRAEGYVAHTVDRGRPFQEQDSQARAQAQVTAGYPDLSKVLASLRATEAKYPRLAKVFDLTRTLNQRPTFEGRHIYAMKISDRVNQEENEPAALFVSNVHARELVTPVIALTAIKKLTEGYGRDPAITSIVNKNEIWIAPVWNPDGYSWVFTRDRWWRKNRRDGIGVDLNRNYPQGWYTQCAGRTDPRSSTYKGPSPASEPETQTMIAWAKQQRFAKMIDFHSRGREVLFTYACRQHPFDEWWQGRAGVISQRAGYGGRIRSPSADGELYQWHLAKMGAYAFLIETAIQFQPPYAEAVREAEQVFSAITHVLQTPLSVRGYVSDAATGAPLAAKISLPNTRFEAGETYGSGRKFGRFDLILPPGPHRLRFDVPGYPPTERSVRVSADTTKFLRVLIGSNRPPLFTASTIDLPTAQPSHAYAQELHSLVTDPNPGDPQTFTKVSGPNWIQVDASGHLSGTPAASDVGRHQVNVRVTDSAEQSAEAMLNLEVVASPSARSPLASARRPSVESSADRAPDVGGCSASQIPEAGNPGWPVFLAGLAVFFLFRAHRRRS